MIRKITIIHRDDGMGLPQYTVCRDDGRPWDDSSYYRIGTDAPAEVLDMVQTFLLGPDEEMDRETCR